MNARNVTLDADRMHELEDQLDEAVKALEKLADPLEWREDVRDLVPVQRMRRDARTALHRIKRKP
jgi:hypothetical protein